MSLQDMMNPTPEVQTFDSVLKDTTKQPLRSWRKKYRKMKLRFDKAMDESSSLFRECHKLEAMAKRLQEENDQFLETLLNLNENSHTRTFDLGSPHEDVNPIPSISSLPALEPDLPKSLSALLATVPHTHLSPDTSKHPIEVAMDTPPGYLTTAYEEEYINNLDPQIAGEEGLDDVWRALRLPPSRQLPNEKELHNANPVSVLSWLRRNHPETFIQEKEAASDRPAPRARGGGGGKRSSLAQATNANANAASAGTPGPKVEGAEEEAEEGGEGLAAGEKAAGGRGRKGKEDEPYRPKGGSSRPSKRKREDGEKGGRGKRAKGAVGTPS